MARVESVILYDIGEKLLNGLSAESKQDTGAFFFLFLFVNVEHYFT